MCGYCTADVCLCFRSRFWPDVAHFTLDLALKLFFEGEMAPFYFLPYMYADVVLPNKGAASTCVDFSSTY